MTPRSIRNKLAKIDPRLPAWVPLSRWNRPRSVYLLGYRHGDGSVFNYEIASHAMSHSEADATTFQFLLAHCIDLARRDAITAPYHLYYIEDDEWALAKEEQLNIWISQRETYINAAPVPDNLVHHTGGHYYTDPSNPNNTILIGRQILHREQVEAPTEARASSLNSPDPLVRGKALYRMSSPINNFMPRFDLNPDRFRALTV